MTTQKTKKETLTVKSSSEPVQGSKELKTALMGVMLTRPEGATIKEMATAFGWLENSVRGAMSTLAKKMGKLHSEKKDGVRYYHLDLNQDIKDAIADPEEKAETIQ